MAPSTGTVHPVRYLALFGVLVVALYALVFFTGDKSATPKLGIDLQGGTRVTLTARTPDGSAPSQDSLKQAQEIIETRVNGLGVSGSEVVVDGDNLVITVPGDDSAQARSLGQTARLYIRPVTGSIDVATRDANRTATPEAPAAETPATDAPAPEAPADGTQTPQNRPFLAQDPTTPEATPAPQTTTPAPTGDAPSDGTDEGDAAAAEIAAARALRQSSDPTVQQQAVANLDCSVADPLRGNDDPTLPLVACSQDGLNIYLLGPSIIDGQEIADASSVFNSQQSRHEISLSFKTTGSNTLGRVHLSQHRQAGSVHARLEGRQRSHDSRCNACG